MATARDFTEELAIARGGWAKVDRAGGRLDVLTDREADALLYVIGRQLAHEEARVMRRATGCLECGLHDELTRSGGGLCWFCLDHSAGVARR